MTYPSFTEALAARPWLLADGATGTNYFQMGLVSGDAPELWNLEHADRVRSLHRRFIEAGADIILTNSFGGNSHRLKLHNLQGRVRELNMAAAANARAEADGAGVRLPAVKAAETTSAPPAAMSDPITRPNAVAKAAIGRIARAKTPCRRPFWASTRTSGTMRAARPAGATGAGLAWSAATIPLRVSAWAAHEEQVLRCA